MNIKKYIIITTLSFSFISLRVHARTQVVRVAQQITKKTHSHSLMQELKELFGKDIALIKADSPVLQEKIINPIKNLLEKRIPHETTRQIAIIKALEYAASIPGFALASSGDYQLIGALSTQLLTQGHWGAAGAVALGYGAAWGYGFEQAKNVSNIANNHVEPDDIIGITNTNSI